MSINRPLKKTRVCPICARQFRTRRDDKIYCCNSCRVSAQRGIPKATQVLADTTRRQRADQKAAYRVRRRKRDQYMSVVMKTAEVSAALSSFMFNQQTCGDPFTGETTHPH